MKAQKLFKYFDKYNKKHFGNELPQVDIIVAPLRSAYGWTEPAFASHFAHDVPGEEDEQNDFVLIILSDDMSNKMQLETLLHEMIHVWQFVKGKDMDHGKSFYKKAKKICKAHNFNIMEF